jgi:hypothetical protein
MFAGLLSTTRQLIALFAVLSIRCVSAPSGGRVIATRFVIHRCASVNGVDQSNAADDVPSSSRKRD